MTVLEGLQQQDHVVLVAPEDEEGGEEDADQDSTLIGIDAA